MVVISQTALNPYKLAPLHLHFQAFFDIGRYILHFLLCDGCKTDFADIQNKKNVEVTDNGKDDF